MVVHCLGIPIHIDSVHLETCLYSVYTYVHTISEPVKEAAALLRTEPMQFWGQPWIS